MAKKNNPPQLPPWGQTLDGPQKPLYTPPGKIFRDLFPFLAPTHAGMAVELSWV